MLRHADPERDAAACAAIYGSFVTGSAVSFETEPPDEREMARRIEAYGESHGWLVEERDGEAVGFAYASPHRARAAYRWAADVAIYLDPAHRGAGVGKQLYGALFDLLRRQRLHVACAGITLPNPASVALHESLGFAAVGIYRRIGFKDGLWRDVGWWQLELRDPGSGAPDEPLGPQRLQSG